MLSKSVVCGLVLRQRKVFWEPASSVEGRCGTHSLIYFNWGKSGRTLLKVQEKVMSVSVIEEIHISKSYMFNCCNTWYITTVTMNVRQARACCGDITHFPARYNYIAMVQMPHYLSNSECFADVLGTSLGTVLCWPSINFLFLAACIFWVGSLVYWKKIMKNAYTFEKLSCIMLIYLDAFKQNVLFSTHHAKSTFSTHLSPGQLWIKNKFPVIQVCCWVSCH